MSKETTIRLRDRREPGHFWADKEIFDIFGDELGQAGIHVYMTLAYLCWGHSISISLRELAASARTSKDTVARGLAQLVRIGLVIEAKAPKGRAVSTYSLADAKALARAYVKQSVSVRDSEAKARGGESPIATQETTSVAGVGEGENNCLPQRQIEVAAEIDRNGEVLSLCETHLSQKEPNLSQNRVPYLNKNKNQEETIPPTPLRGDAQDELDPPDPDGKQRGIWEFVNRTRAREGRAAIGWAAWVQQQIAGGSWPDAGTPDAAPDQEFARCADCNEAAELVMRRCGLLEMRLLPVIAGALLSEMQRTGVAAGAVGERACVSFLAYRAQAGSLRYAWGPKRFFSEGYWLDPRSWPADRDSARSREALVGTCQG